MKNFIYALGMFSVTLAHAQSPLAPAFNAPEFLSHQDASTCSAKQVMDFFKREQLIETATPALSNFNGNENVNSKVGAKLDGQSIESTNMGYWLKVRMLDSGLGGETLSVYFPKDSCTPSKAFSSSGGEFTQIRLVSGQCFERPVRKIRVRPGAPVASPTPPPPMSIKDKLCNALKGDQP